MYKLIIVDDEKIIRETIHSLINWESLDIEVIGLCKNGLDAYDTIQDKNPDIVLTDIKMPGLTGIELIKQVRELDINVEFIILSGFGEFALAKEAMKYGVKHYLLKPCNEQQIIDVVAEVILDCTKKAKITKMAETQRNMSESISQNAMKNFLLLSLTSP